MKLWKLAALGCALVLAGCGGGGSADTAPKTSVSAVKVFGDSIVDSGAFGFKLTIQGDTPATAFQIFPERIAASFGFSKLCAFFNFNGTTFIPDTACTNYAVAKGRINNLTNTELPSNAVPFSIPFQMAIGSAALKPTDLVIIDGGSNDLADITGAYLGATTPAGVGNYIAALSTLLPPATVSAIIGVPTATSLAMAGGAYAQALAQLQASAVQTHILSKGVTKVLVLNSVDFTITPRFQAVLGGVSAAAGGGATGAAQAAAVQGAIRAWINAFNISLAQSLVSPNVQIFDFYTEGNRIIAAPAQYGLTNITIPACPIVAGGVDPDTGQASLNFPQTVAACNPTYLSANIPATEPSTSPNWWQGYAFSDNFHPSPELHKLIAQTISVQLARVGWL